MCLPPELRLKLKCKIALSEITPLWKTVAVSETQEKKNLNKKLCMETIECYLFYQLAEETFKYVQNCLARVEKV